MCLGKKLVKQLKLVLAKHLFVSAVFNTFNFLVLIIFLSLYFDEWKEKIIAQF